MKSETPIIAKKELFRLWYEFYLLALNSEELEIVKALKKSAKFYADWGSDKTLKFDKWWIEHRHLFHDTETVRKVDANFTKRGDCLYFEVPKNKSYGDLVEEFKVALLGANPRAKRGRKIPTKHRYAPTEIQGVKEDSLRMMLDLQKRVFKQDRLKGAGLTMAVQTFFKQDRYIKKLNEIPSVFAEMVGSLDHSESAERNIRRYRQKAKKLILNVANGQFPGKY
jgi:hypothetical protein